jgi:hypothetical protein
VTCRVPCHRPLLVTCPHCRHRADRQRGWYRHPPGCQALGAGQPAQRQGGPHWQLLFPDGIGAAFGVIEVPTPELNDALAYDASRSWLIVRNDFEVAISNQYAFASDSTAIRVRAGSRSASPPSTKRSARSPWLGQRPRTRQATASGPAKLLVPLPRRGLPASPGAEWAVRAGGTPQAGMPGYVCLGQDREANAPSDPGQGAGSPRRPSGGPRRPLSSAMDQVQASLEGLTGGPFVRPGHYAGQPRDRKQPP